MLAVSGWADAPGEPWPLIRLVRMAAGGDPIRPYSEARIPLNVVGMAAVTGLSENWLVECHDSFGTIEAADRALAQVPARPASGDGGDEVLPSGRTLIGVLRPNWSYRPDEAIRLLTKARYMFVSVYRVRSGASVDFAEMANLRKLEFDSVNSERPEMVYQIISGAPAGAYIFLAPLASLSVLDNGRARHPIYADGVLKGPRPSTADVSREHLIFRVEPRLSWLSDDFTSADPEFWTGKAKAQ